MSIRPESPGEIYEDKHGYRWLVVMMCNEPTVTMQMIQPHWGKGRDEPSEQGGSIYGLMWDGFRKIAEAPNTEVVNAPSRASQKEKCGE